MNSQTLKLKTGFTTGTCAQAAVKGASIMLISKEWLDFVEVETPSYVRLKIKLIDQEIREDFTRCGVIKEAGSLDDITNGIKIYAELRPSLQDGISIKGGEGIGRVTRPGLPVKVGDWAINPIPRKMILREASRLFPRYKGIEITINAEGGDKIAKDTYNPKLGIIGGISILGTTGIVEPKSSNTYKASLALKLDLLVASGHRKVVFVFGYLGETYCKEFLRLKEPVIKIGDHVGFMVRECAKRGISDVLLVGHIGKMIKVAGGQFNTHYRFGDNRLDLIARYAKDFGCKDEVIKELLMEETTEATIEILRREKLTRLFNKIAKECSSRLTRLVDNKVRINCIILSLKGDVLGIDV